MALGLGATCCQAGFVLVEDFNGLTNGPVNGQHGWVGSGTDGRVVADPADPANRVLAVTNSVSANIYHALGSLSLPAGNARCNWSISNGSLLLGQGTPTISFQAGKPGLLELT